MPHAPKFFRAPGQLSPQQYDRQRNQLEYRRWYKTARWLNGRRYHLATNPLCVECTKLGYTTAATVVDHVVPHRGNAELFWDQSNWQSLCERCHNRKTRRGA